MNEDNSLNGEVVHICDYVLMWFISGFLLINAWLPCASCFQIPVKSLCREQPLPLLHTEYVYNVLKREIKNICSYQK